MKKLRGTAALAAVITVFAVVPAVALAPGDAAIEGNVIEWGTGEPISGVTVTAGPYSAVTDGSGDYRIDGVSPMVQYNVYFDHPDASYTDAYYPNVANQGNATLLTVTADETLIGIDAALQPEGVLIGRVRDDDTGQPVAGICGEVFNNAASTGRTGVSDADGWLTIDYAGSEYEQNVVHLTDCNNIGYADEWYPDQPGFGPVGGDDVFQPSADPGYVPTMGRFDALLGTAGSIEGIVTDHLGQPIADICVAAATSAQTQKLPAEQTDASGVFSIGGLSAYDAYELHYWDCGSPVEYADGTTEEIVVVSGAATTVPVVMAGTASVSGTVTDRSGQPIEGICVSVTTVAGYAPTSGDVFTDAQGRYSIAVADADNHWAVANGCHYFHDDSYVTQWYDGVAEFDQATELALSPLETRTGVDFELDAMAKVFGNVTRTDGGPAIDACVSAGLDPDGWPTHTATVDASGKYSIDTIEPGTYTVWFGCDYRGEYYDDTPERAEAQRFTLGYNDVVTLDAVVEPVGFVQGQVLASSGSVGEACVYLTDLNGIPTESLDPDIDLPAYLFDEVSLGDHLIYVEDCDTTAPSFAPTWWHDAPTRDAADTLTVEQRGYGEVDIWVDPYPDVATTVSGSLLKDGEPWDACVTVFDENLAVVGTSVGQDGEYTVGDIELFGPQAALLVRAEDCGGGIEAWYGGDTQAEADEIPYGAGIEFTGRDISIGVAPPDPIELTVAVNDLLGSPLPGMCVAVAGAAEPNGKTGADGSVVFYLTESGTYDIVAGVTGTDCAGGYVAKDARITLTGDTSVVIALGLETVPFGDSADLVFADDIEWLAAAGVTRGCNPPLNDEFCPNDLVTRGQMAAFLVRALGLTDSGSIDFRDDDGLVFEASIERLAAAGITRGCNPPANDRFCPNDPVTRGQMAAFLVRALGLSDPGSVDFVDDDESPFEPSIERLAAAGITRGCNPPANDRFCPNDPVTRGQMAAFLRRALNRS